MTATKGIAFGELALLHNAPRAATVQASAILRFRRNSGAILAQFWRNSAPFWRNSLTPRPATVQCTSASCTAWSLDMLSFKTILMGKSQV